MRTQYIFRLFPIFILLSLMISCTDESSIISKQNEENKTLRLCFNAAPPTFDSLSTRAMLEWPDSATLYIKFYGSISGYTVGKGVYSKSSNEWTLTYTGTIESDKGLSCEVWYFENMGNGNVSLSSLSPYSCIYYDATAEYFLNNGTMNVDAQLHPKSARLKFKGTPGTELKLSGWPHYSSFNSATFSFSDTKEAFDLSVGEDGYTQYVYSDIAEHSVVNLELTLNTSYVFSRDFIPETFQSGKSYSLAVPSDNSNTWSSTRIFNLNGSGKSVTFRMIEVKNGQFEMGRIGTIDVATPVHTVSLTKDYYMGETEVTNALWYAVMGNTPSSKNTKDDYPVETISYSDCQSFLSALNSKLSSLLSSGEQFRFPTEAEWEFAAKGGTKTKGYTYSGSNVIDDVAWYTNNSNSTTHPVKTKAANELGLYDMSGNVLEWCLDWYGSYRSDAQTDPTGPASGSFRVLRGGGWYNYVGNCRVAYRLNTEPTDRHSNYGLRLCLGAPIPVLPVSQTSLSFGANASSQSITVTAYGDYTYSSSASWLTITQSSDNSTLTISVSANPNSYERTATITLTLGSLSQTISVNQKANEDIIYTVTGNGKTVTFKMIKVESGTFQMGSATGYGNETPVHSVTISKDYYICETEVTQALWYAVMGLWPTSDGNKWSNAYGLGDERPAYYISYEDCQSFLSALNSKLSSQLGNGKQFRFPTESEWEYAAKGGRMSQGYTYSGSNTIEDVAWFYDNSEALGSSNANFGTHDVKTKYPNELGLYDMSGNVWEWCYDWYGSYNTGVQTDPTGLTSGSSRVLRGGAWNSKAESIRVVFRSGSEPTDNENFNGFRLCLGAPIEQLNGK